MWKDLSVQQKSKVMKIYLQNGITTLSDMMKHYDSINGHIGAYGMELDGDNDPLSDENISQILTRYKGWAFTGLSDQQKKREIENYRKQQQFAQTVNEGKAILSQAVGQDLISTANRLKQRQQKAKAQQPYAQTTGDLQYAPQPRRLTEDDIAPYTGPMDRNQATIGQSSKTKEEILALPDHYDKELMFGNLPLGRYIHNFNNTVQDLDNTLNSTPFGAWANPLNLFPQYWTLKGFSKMLDGDPFGAVDVVAGNLDKVIPIAKNIKSAYKNAKNSADYSLDLCPKNVAQVGAVGDWLTEKIRNGNISFRNKTGFTPTQFLKTALKPNGFGTIYETPYATENLVPVFKNFRTKDGTPIVALDDPNAATPVFHDTYGRPHMTIKKVGEKKVTPLQQQTTSNFMEKETPYITPQGKTLYRKTLTLENTNGDLSDLIYADLDFEPGTGFHFPLAKGISQGSPKGKFKVDLNIPINSPEYYAYMENQLNGLQKIADEFDGVVSGSTRMFRENHAIPNDVEFEMTKANADKFVKKYGKVNRNLQNVDGYNVIITKDIVDEQGNVLIKATESNTNPVTVDIPFIDSKHPKLVRETNLDVKPQQSIEHYTQKALQNETGDIPLYTPEEAVNNMRQQNTKFVSDTLKSQNPKHQRRAKNMLLSEEPETIESVQRAMDHLKSELPEYADYYTEGIFDNVNSNKEFLKNIFDNIPDTLVIKFANNPKIMKNIVDKWYYENTVTTGLFNKKFTNWSIEESARANSSVADAFGGGRNTTTGPHGGNHTSRYGNTLKIAQVPFSYSRKYKNAMDLYNDFMRTSDPKYDNLVQQEVPKILKDLGININTSQILDSKWSNIVANEMFSKGYSKQEVRNTIYEISKRLDSPGYFSNTHYGGEGKYVGDYTSPDRLFIMNDNDGIGFEKTNILDKYAFSHNTDNNIFYLNKSLIIDPKYYQYDDFNIPINTNKTWRGLKDQSIIATNRNEAIQKLKNLPVYDGNTNVRYFTKKQIQRKTTAEKLKKLQQYLQIGIPTASILAMLGYGIYDTLNDKPSKDKQSKDK